MNAHPGQFREALPDALEAEQALLGAILISNDAYWRVAGFLKPQHFAEGIHGQLYEIMGTMIAEGRGVNPITIKPYIPASAMVGELTLFAYVVQLAAGAVTISGTYDLGRAVIEMWSRHQLISAARDLESLAQNIPVDMTPEKIIGEITGRFVTISGEISEGTKAITMAEAVDQAVKSIDDAYRFKKRVGVLTGVEAVDQLTGPWEPGQQVIIGGGTKQGKSALAMQCVVGLAAHGPVWVYSGEMSVKQLAMREIARRTGIPVWRQKEGRLSVSERERLEFVKQDVERLPIFIEKRRLTLEQIHQIGRELKMERGLAAMAIDHVGLLAWGKENSRRDEWELSQIATRELKAIYEDLGIPGMSLVQLKKNTFSQFDRNSFVNKMRDAINRRPKYTDMMGAVERDADHVLIPFNARPILAGLEPEEGSDDHILWEGKMSEHERRAEIILALSREQKFPDRRQVEWHGETTSFGPAFVGRQESLGGILD